MKTINFTATTILYSILFFTDHLMIGRGIFNNDLIGFLLIFIAGFWVFFSRKKILLAYFIRSNNLSIFLLIALFFSFTITIRLINNQSYGNLIQYSVLTICVLLLIPLLNNNNERDKMIDAYIFASLLHLLTVFDLIPYINNNLANNTAYGFDEYNIGIFTRRSTGFFNSPGSLSLFATGGLSLSISLFSQKNKKKSIFLMITSILLGFFAFSRSFFVVSSALLIYQVLFLDLKNKLLIIFIILSLIIGSRQFSVINDYYNFILARMENITDIDNNDRIIGETGLIETIEVIKNYPLFGNPVSIEGGSLRANNEGIYIRPHSGILALLCFYGILFSSPLLFLIKKGIIISFRNVIYKKKGDLFSLAFISINIVCLVEPLIDTSVYFYILISLLTTNQLMESQFQ